MPGNLASEQVTKRDVFHIFHHYGKIAQISIKQAYGFVQYYSAEACQQALVSQEGTELRGKKIREFVLIHCLALANRP
jgi:RNA recognition motif-containing protein